MNNDKVEVDTLILELADYKNDLADMAAEKLLRKARRVGNPTNTCETACMKAGYPIALGSSCDRLSNGFNGKCSSADVQCCITVVILAHAVTRTSYSNVYSEARCLLCFNMWWQHRHRQQEKVNQK